MLKSVLTRAFATAALALCVGTISASAQATRTWVSGVGDDVNPCSRTAPCKTFAGAISKTAAGGEINVIDPGSFGTVTITKAITIDGGGGFAAVLASGVTGVTVNAGVNDKVILRNLSINGAGTGVNGIRYLAGKSLTVESTRISGFTTHGIDVALGNNGILVVKDTDIQNVSGSGIRLNTTFGLVKATLDRVRVEGAGVDGVDAVEHSRVVVSNSIFTQNGNAGIHAESPLNNDAIVDVSNCDISFNNFGLHAGNGGVSIRITNNHITNNNVNWTLGGGLVFSFGDNTVTGNVTTNVANGAPAPAKS
jgi:hypothetical protein